MAVVLCEICTERIGTVDADEIRQKGSYTGRDFGSIDPAHGVPPPFHPSLTWMDMRCPYGPHRPFIAPDRLTLEGGIVLELNGRVTPPSPVVPDGDRSPALPEAVESTPSTISPSATTPSVVSGTEVPVLKCPKCGKECGSQIGLVSHMKRKHKE